MIEPPQELLEFLEPYDRGVQELTLALRQVVIEELAPCCEYILEVYCVALLYGTTHKVKDGICYIGVSKNHVNLSFNRGTDLADPKKILEGAGKRTRHVKIRNMSDLLRPVIRAYLREACERAGHDVANEKAREVTTVVKGKCSPKRVIGSARL
jgi:hypothetical protein